MAKSINTLLKKKTWTGIEVGKLIMAGLVYDINHRHDAGYKPLFTQEELDMLESNLQNDRQFTAYAVYADLYHGLVEAYNSGEAFIQQFNNGYYRYIFNLTSMQQAEEAYSNSLLAPFVVSQTQYDRYKEEAKAKKVDYAESFASILFSIITSTLFVGEITKDITAAIVATKKEPATNSRILATYNRDIGHGYYTLPNGLRSDQCTEEEWEQAKEKVLYKKYLQAVDTSKGTPDIDTAKIEWTISQTSKLYQLFFEGAEGIRELYKSETGKELPEDLQEDKLCRAMELIALAAKNDARAENVKQDKYTDFLLDFLEIAEKWLYYEETPELTKYDLLVDCLERYSGALAEDIPEEEQLKEFIADYPEVFETIKAYIIKHIPAFKGIEPENYCEPAITWQELSDLGFLDYRELLEVTEMDIQQLFTREDTPELAAEDYAKRSRIMYGGIAIVQNPAKHMLESNGDYADNSNYLFNTAQSLETLLRREDKQKELLAMRGNLFIPAIKYLYAFNALIDILSIQYEVPELEEIKKNVELPEGQIDAYNQLVTILYLNVEGTPEMKANKREAIKRVFSQIDIESLKPTAEAIEKVTEELQELGLSKKTREKVRKLDSYIDILMGKEE